MCRRYAYCEDGSGRSIHCWCTSWWCCRRSLCCCCGGLFFLLLCTHAISTMLLLLAELDLFFAVGIHDQQRRRRLLRWRSGGLFSLFLCTHPISTMLLLLAELDLFFADGINDHQRRRSLLRRRCCLLLLPRRATSRGHVNWGNVWVVTISHTLLRIALRWVTTCQLHVCAMCRITCGVRV